MVDLLGRRPRVQQPCLRHGQEGVNLGKATVFSIVESMMDLATIILRISGRDSDNMNL